MMLWQILRFEVRLLLKQPLFWLVTFLFTLMGFGLGASDANEIGGAVGNVLRNAPSVIVTLLSLIGTIGIFLTTIFVAGAILRDFEAKTHELFFSRPIAKRDYLLGRFLGSYLMACVAFSGSAFGLFLGSVMPWIDPERLGSFGPAPYLYALFVIVLPNLLFSACVFFCLASLSRSMLRTYMGVVGFFALSALSDTLLDDLDNEFLAAWLDPFGIGALDYATKYWTVVERNSLLPELGGIVLYNRLLWVGIGLAFLAYALYAFRPTATLLRKRRTRGLSGSEQDAGAPATGSTTVPTIAPTTVRKPAAKLTFSTTTALHQFWHQTRLEMRSIFKGVLFLVLLAFGTVNLIGLSSVLDQIVGTPAYPVTYLMLTVIQGAFAFLLFIIITFYCGELIWKERSLNLSEVYDAMPVPNWVYLSAKLVGQGAVIFAFLAYGTLVAIGIQIYRGYYHFELGVYAKGLLVIVIPFLLLACLASFFQVSAGKKSIGFLLMILFFISRRVMGSLDLDHYLYRYASNLPAPYSDMNGYGHFVQPLFWFYLYWCLGAAILTVLAMLLWVRGTDTAWKTRLRIAAQRFQGPFRVALPALVLAFLATGGWIFYNTNVLNEYLPSDQAEAQQAEYEKKYRQYKDIALPRVTGVEIDVDIFPQERRVEARGVYRLANRNAEALQDLHISIPRRVQVNALELPAHSETLRDELYGYTIVRLDEPLAPGAEIDMRFDLTIANPGFVAQGSDTSIVANGTFFNSRQYFPTFGYNERAQLTNRNLRRKYDLPPVERAAKVDDLFARRNTYISSDSDWIDFETTVSTSADQIAIAPGYLQKEWTEGDRRYFHYKMDAPILNFYAYLSADYTVERDRHGDVAIEIFHHHAHRYNVDRMIDSIKKSLDYFTAEFGPYQHRQIRIIEFPRYSGGAQAFPNTVPFSEAAGFIARLDEGDPEAIDYPFYVTSHEVAHQWWAHQVIGGNVQGSTMLSETMSQYAALMVMEKEYGPEKMRRFLKYELDRYLRGRSGELVEEMPLMLVENQAYIQYFKGSLVMYALREAIGEESLNRALARYVEAVKFQQPPYTNTLEFMDFLRPEVPEDQQELLADLFETITLFENRVEDASYAERADGKFVVTLNAKARKVRADGQGVESEVPLDDWIEIGVFGETQDGGRREETVLLLEKRHITDEDVTFELVVDEKPVRAGIDPYNKLVDRNSDDNVKRVSQTTLAELGAL